MKALGFALMCSVFINAALIYRVFDLGLTITHGSDDAQYRAQQSSDLTKVLSLLLKSTTRTQVLAAGKEAGLDVIEKQEEGDYVGTVFFSYSKGKVKTVVVQK